MSEGAPSRIEVAREAVGSIIKTLSNTDAFGIITFNTTADAIVSEKIMLGTKRNRDRSI